MHVSYSIRLYHLTGLKLFSSNNLKEVDTPDYGKTRRERLKSAQYLTLKKHKVSKTVKGDPLSFLEIQFVAKYQKKEAPFYSF